MSLTARLKKAEKTAGVGQRCLNCRGHYIKFGHEIKRTAAADLFATTCRVCGLPLKLILSGYTQREREIVVRVATAEDKFANSLKWLGCYAWMHHLPRFSEIEEIGKAEERRLRDAVKVDAGARQQVKILDELHARQEKLQKVYEEQKKKEASERVRDVCSPVLDALDEVRKEQRTLDYTIFCYRVMAEMEVFMWGKKRAETLNLIETRQREIDEEKARLKREAEERERKYQEERRQREEERRRQNEEWLARNRASPYGVS